MKTVLLVEEDKRDRQELSAIIHKSGISIDTILECSSAQDAIYILKNQKIDVMFTTINLLGINGIELVQEVRQIDKSLRIVVASESDEFVHAVQLLRLGAREYLLKPIQRQQVIDILSVLEEEIVRTRENSITTSMVMGQQLKQMLLGGSASQGELDSMMRQCDSVLFRNPYVVCCLDNLGADSYITDQRGYLGSVEQSELYILEESILDKIRLQEWRRRFVGVSNVHVGMEQLQKAYQESLYARIESFYREKYVVMFQDLSIDIEKQSVAQEGVLKESDISNMIHMLGTAKTPQVEKLVKSFLWSNKRKRDIQELQMTMSHFFEGIEQSYPMVAREELEEIRNLKSPLSYATIDIYEHMLLQWMEVMIQKLQKHLDEYKNKEKMQSAIAYIQANYSQDFNMAVVSNEVSMNYSLFSIAFKEYTGTNFVNYLKEIRMEKAKEYLQTSEMKISEISQKVGYENEKHFMKLFKVMYGISPTEYRKSVQLKK